jgi:proteasome lid subunit RPN8/RPN11
VKRVLLPAPAWLSIEEHAAEAYPREACGLLVGVGGRVTRAVRCPNVAPAAERTNRFEIDPRAVINVRRTLRTSPEAILGFYHSHPDDGAAPSRTDLEYMRLWPETVWLIASVHEGIPARACAWWLDPDASQIRELPLETVEPASLAGCGD